MKTFYFFNSQLKKSVRVTFAVFLLLFICSLSTTAQCSTVDQSQLNYNGGMSARNLAQYTVWQDFTAGATGTLCGIDVGFFNPMTGTGTLNVFSGTGTGGTSLLTQTVTVSGTGNFFQSFAVSVPVTSGSVYTFQFIPTQGGGLPDPYGVQVENPGSYSGGQMEITDPSGTYTTGFDMVFKTYVNTTTGITSLTPSPVISIFPNPVTSEAQITVSEEGAGLIISDSFGRVIRQMEGNGSGKFILEKNGLACGVYFASVIVKDRVMETKKLVVTD